VLYSLGVTSVHRIVDIQVKSKLAKLPGVVHVTVLMPDFTTTPLFSIVNGRLISPHSDVVEHVTVVPMMVQVGVLATTTEE